MKKICVVTGTRAEYGIMSRLMHKLASTEEVTLQIVATNMHLSEAHGMTIREIESDGFNVDKKIPLPLDDDSARGTVYAMSMALSGFADAFAELNPDLILILGDRFEMLAAASAAAILGIPVAHLHGGEITEGAYDDAIRHAITKLSTYHFTATEEYRRRVIQMGEEPQRVFNAGSLGVDNIRSESLLDLQEFNSSLLPLIPNMDFPIKEGFMLVTFHPVTRQPEEAECQTKALLGSLDKFKNYQILFTMPNSDTGGRSVATLIENWVKSNRRRAVCVTSLGRKRYYSALAHCGSVIGNSSSGLIEAPSFGVPTVNIGDRQKGRVFGNTVINCGVDVESITSAIRESLLPDFRNFCKTEGDNPYAGTNTLDFILSKLLTVPVSRHMQKHFYDL